MSNPPLGPVPQGPRPTSVTKPPPTTNGSEIYALLLLLALIFFTGIPITLIIIYHSKYKSVADYKPLKQEKNEKNEKSENKEWPRNPTKNSLPSIEELMRNQKKKVLEEPRNGFWLNSENDDDKLGMGRRGSQDNDDSFCLNITASDFELIFESLKYDPDRMEMLTAEERDPSVTLMRNWFEYCQPIFNYPEKLSKLCLKNSDVDRNPAHRSWDNTAYLVDNKHFIKASIVPIPGSTEKSIIVCQAPIDDKEPGKKETRGIFWKMVDEKKSEMIVMACQHKENGVVKCGKYFPDAVKIGEVFGDYKVTMVDQREMFEGELIIRRIEYYNKNEKIIVPSSLQHYQFINWKEGEIPKTLATKKAIKFVIKQARRQNKTIIVHSSIGTGRASVFAGIEYLSWAISVFKQVNTHSFSVEFRTHVMNGIQTGQQLFFVQNMVLEMIMTALECDDFKEKMEQQWNFLANYNETGLEHRNAMKQLEAEEIEQDGEVIGFKAPRGFKRLVDIKKLEAENAKKKPKTGNEDLKAQLEEIRKKKEERKKAKKEEEKDEKKEENKEEKEEKKEQRTLGYNEGYDDNDWEEEAKKNKENKTKSEDWNKTE
ncbi:unnamed protein product [Caenorhabditis nigoni]